MKTQSVYNWIREDGFFLRKAVSTTSVWAACYPWEYAAE